MLLCGILLHHFVLFYGDICIKEGKTYVFNMSAHLRQRKNLVQHSCHTVTFFRQHKFSLKYSLLMTSLYQNHYQNDNQIVYRCYMQTLLSIHDLCTFNLLVRIIVVIIKNIGHSRLLPTFLYQNSFVEGIIWKHLLLHYQVLANKDLVNPESSSP